MTILLYFENSLNEHIFELTYFSGHIYFKTI